MKAPLSIFQLLLAASVALILTSCATSYQPNSFTGGYSETRLAPDVFRVVFSGNGYTSAERAQDFALLRACELVLQGGYTCFAVIDERNATTTSSFTIPGHAETTAYGSGYSSGNIYLNPYGGTYSGTSSAYVNENTTYTPPQTYVFYKPQSGLLVRAFPVKPDGFFTFDAAFLQQSLKQKYQIKEAVADSYGGATTDHSAKEPNTRFDQIQIATSPDWNARIGNYAFNQAVADFGMPDSSSSANGNHFTEWVGPKGTPYKSLALSFGPDGKLLSFAINNQ